MEKRKTQIRKPQQQLKNEMLKPNKLVWIRVVAGAAAAAAAATSKQDKYAPDVAPSNALNL